MSDQIFSNLTVTQTPESSDSLRNTECAFLGLNIPIFSHSPSSFKNNCGTPLFSKFAYMLIILLQLTLFSTSNAQNITSCESLTLAEKYNRNCTLTLPESIQVMIDISNKQQTHNLLESQPYCEFLDMYERFSDNGCDLTDYEHWYLFFNGVFNLALTFIALVVFFLIFKRINNENAIDMQMEAVIDHQQEIRDRLAALLEPQSSILEHMHDYDDYITLFVNIYGFYTDITRFETDNFLSIMGNLVFACLRFVINYVKASTAVRYVCYIFEEMIAEDDLLEPQASLPRQFVDNWKSLSESELSQKFSRVIIGLISCPLTKEYGLDFTSRGLTNFANTQASKIKFTSVPELIRTGLDLIVTFAETGHECFMEQSIQPILVHNRSARTWLLRFQEIMHILAEKPINENFSPTEALSLIDELITSGTSLNATNPREIGPCWRILMDKRLKLVQEYNVSCPRKPPFSVLVHGTPGIGKSTIMQNIATIYHAVVKDDIYPDLDWDPAKHLYSFNCKDSFWSGYQGARHWCIVLDDLGREHPKHVASGKTTSIDEVIDIINTISLASNQAAVEDKGAIPIVPKLVVGSTNTKHLNAHFAVAEASAVLRRFPIVIEPILKPEYLDADTGMMRKLTEVVRDAWDFKVELVKLTVTDGNVRVKYDLQMGSAINGMMTGAELSKFLKMKILEHEMSSQVMMESNKVGSDVHMCSHGVLSYYDCAECQITKDVCFYDANTFGSSLEPQSWNPFSKRTSPVVSKTLKTQFRSMFIRGTLAIFPFSLASSIFFRCGPDLFVTACLYYFDNLLPPKTRLARDRIRRYVAYGFTTVMLAYLLKMFLRKEVVEPQSEVKPKRNIWAFITGNNDHFTLPPSFKNNNIDELQQSLSKGTFRLAVETNGAKIEVTAIAIRHGWYATVAHPFEVGDSWRCVAEYQARDPNVTIIPSNGFILERSNMKFLGNDVVAFSCSGILPRKEMYNFLPSKVDTAGRNFHIYDPRFRGILGNGSSTFYRDIEYFSLTGTGKIKGTFMEATRSDRNPLKGDCGSIVFSQAFNGHYISGIHCAGAPRGLGSRMIITQLSKEMFNFSAPLLAMSGYSNLTMIEKGSTKSGKLMVAHPSKGVHHWVEGCAISLGSFANRTTSSSRTKESIICSRIEKDFAIKNEFTSPLMIPKCVDGTWKNPFVIATQSQANVSPHFEESVILKCAMSYVDDITLNGEWLSDVGSVDLHVAINGINGDSFINQIPMSTSGGFFFPGAKKQYFTQLFDDDGLPYYLPSQEIKDMVQQLESNYLLGHRNCILFNGTLKDEPVKHSKKLSGKTRVFTACDVAFSLVVRKQFLKITRAIMSNNFLTECAVGMNCYSLDWERLHNYITLHGEGRMIAGDFKEYDKKMAAVLIRAAFWILEELIMNSLTTSHADIMIMRGVATDISYPIVNMNGDVIQFFGSNSSGHPLTVIVNSLVNSLYIRHAYQSLYDLRTFKSNVKVMTLGDDNIINSKKTDFNHTYIASHLYKYGVIYTMADKESVSIPFIHISEIDFLKRKFVELDGRIVGPLALSSIFKSLMMYVEKGNISHAEQLSQSYLAARREWSLHGREVFSEFTQKMENIFVDFPDVSRFFLLQHKYTYEETRVWVCE